MVAFLRAPWAVSPAKPGSVSATQEVDRDRELDAERVALVARPVDGHAVLQEADGVVERLGPQAELLVRLGLHEVEVVAVAVQELDRAAVDLGPRPALARLERLLDRAALLDVAQLDPDLGRAAAHLDVVVVEDLPEVAVKLDDDALAQLAGADHGVGAPVARGAVGGVSPPRAGRLDCAPDATRGRARNRAVSAERDHVAREVRQPLDDAACGVEVDEVLDAHAGLALEVDPGLDREHRRARQRLVGAAPPEPRQLVRREPDPVAQAVAEVPASARRRR